MVIIILLQMLLGDAPENDVSIAIGQAWVESRYDPKAVSAQVGESIYQRRTGHWDGPFPKTWKAPFYCGLWQTKADTEADCVAQQEILVAWAHRTDEMKRWLKFCRGNMTCALNGHACGIAGAQTGQCKGYAERVLWRARDLHRPSS